jgi:hypothetical protein
MNRGTTLNKIWDKIGICASGLCLIHCLATPVLLVIFPAFKFAEDSHGHDQGHATFHEIFGIIVIASIMLAVFPNCRKHGHYDIMAIALAGMVLVLTGIFVHEIPEIASQITTVIGSVLLITAHVKNMKVRHGKCQSEAACTGH